MKSIKIMTSINHDSSPPKNLFSISFIPLSNKVINFTQKMFDRFYNKCFRFVTKNNIFHKCTGKIW